MIQDSQLGQTTILIGMLVTLLVLGFFIDQTSIMMITLRSTCRWARLRRRPRLVRILYLLCMQIGLLTPPFGLLLFVLKGVAPPGITIGTIYSRGDPLCLADDPDDGVDLRHPGIVTAFAPS